MRNLTAITDRYRFKLTWEFKLADFWIGFYFKRTLPENRPTYGSQIDIWICIIPCFPLHFIIGEING
jgi:hypothetical protein